MKDIFRHLLLAHAAPYCDGDGGDDGDEGGLGGFADSPGGAPTAAQSGVSGSGSSSAAASVNTSVADALGPTSSGSFGMSGPTGSSASAPSMSMAAAAPSSSGPASSIGTVGDGLSGFGGAFGGGNEGFGGFGDFGGEIGGPVGSVSSPTAGMTGAHSGGGTAFAGMGAGPIGAAPDMSFAQQYGQGPGLPTVSGVNFAFDVDDAQAAIGQGLGTNVSLGQALGGMPAPVSAPGNISAAAAMTPEQANQAAFAPLAGFGVAPPGPLSEPIGTPPPSTFAVDPYFTNPTPLAQVAPPAQPVDPLGIAANPVSVQAINIDQYLNPEPAQVAAPAAAPNIGFANPAAMTSLNPAMTEAMASPMAQVGAQGFAPAGHSQLSSNFAAAPGQFAPTSTGFASAMQAAEPASMISAAAPPAGPSSAANVSSLGITGSFAAPPAPAAPASEFNIAETQPENAPIAPGFATSFSQAPAAAPPSAQAAAPAPQATAPAETAPASSFAQAPPAQEQAQPAAPASAPPASTAQAPAAPPAAPPATTAPVTPIGGGGFAIALDTPEPVAQPEQNPFGQVGSMAIQGTAGMLGSGLGTVVGGPVGGVVGGLVGTALGGAMANASPMTDAWSDDTMGNDSTGPDMASPVRDDPRDERNMAERIEETYLLPMFGQAGNNSGRMTPYERFVANRSNYGRSLQG